MAENNGGMVMNREPATDVAPPIRAVAWAICLFGGAVLIGAMVFTTAAVIMSAFGRPLLGDTEVIAFSSGMALACFMPWCQIERGHIAIDAFTGWLRGRASAALDAGVAVLFAVVVAILSWRLILGGIDAFERDRITMFLEIRLWWGYAVAALPMLLWTVVCCDQAVRRVRAAAGRE